jgi:glutathione peroxidase
MPTLYDFQAVDIEGKERKLSDYTGKLCLIVNVASECGLTPQYDGLQRLHTRYHRPDAGGNGLEILAFPCNQFGDQEPGENGEIQEFCRTQFAVEFSMFGKVDVNGEARIPLYDWLTAEPSEPDSAGEIAWNFAKFLIDREGQVMGRFAPTVEPCSSVITDRIDEALKTR